MGKMRLDGYGSLPTLSADFAWRAFDDLGEVSLETVDGLADGSTRSGHITSPALLLLEVIAIHEQVAVVKSLGLRRPCLCSLSFNGIVSSGCSCPLDAFQSPAFARTPPPRRLSCNTLRRAKPVSRIPFDAPCGGLHAKSRVPSMAVGRQARSSILNDSACHETSADLSAPLLYVGHQGAKLFWRPARLCSQPESAVKRVFPATPLELSTCRGLRASIAVFLDGRGPYHYGSRELTGAFVDGRITIGI
jgi:hypothetical protein